MEMLILLVIPFSLIALDNLMDISLREIPPQEESKLELPSHTPYGWMS